MEKKATEDKRRGGKKTGLPANKLALRALYQQIEPLMLKKSMIPLLVHS